MISLLLLLGALVAASPLPAQDGARAREPIVLEHADSLVGMGDPGDGQREFVGNVRFRQGNVTVACDRALHSPATNVVDLFGRVVVSQQGLQLRAPVARYDGNLRLATAFGGITVTEGRKTVQSRRGTYSTADRVATFVDSVAAFDDTTRVWSDRAVYHRDSRRTEAAGRVVIWDTVQHRRLRGDSVLHDPERDYALALGHAAAWSWDPDSPDTTLIMADTLERFAADGGEGRFVAGGSAVLVSGTAAARGAKMWYAEQTGEIRLLGDPVLWADSAQLIADTIDVIAPNRRLQQVVGRTNAIMISRTDTVHAERYDQVSGVQVILEVEADTIRKLTSIGDARSITYQNGEKGGEGLAQFRADTIKAYFEEGKPADIYWLGSVQGEHHPEHLVAGMEGRFRLPGFEWRTDRPRALPIPVPWSPFGGQVEPRVKSGSGTGSNVQKKK